MKTHRYLLCVTSNKWLKHEENRQAGDICNTMKLETGVLKSLKNYFITVQNEH